MSSSKTHPVTGYLAGPRKSSLTRYIKRHFAHKLDFLTMKQTSSQSSEFSMPRSIQAGTVWRLFRKAVEGTSEVTAKTSCLI